MEKLDIYDEYMNKIGSEDRDIVHEQGMWHKTIHCWMYDDDGNVYFQIRSDSNKLYTTASGHVLAGETVRDAFKREIAEEIGLDVDVTNAQPIEITFWRQDKIKNDKPWHDRAFSHIYINKLPKDFNNFNFQLSEVNGVVKINAKKCLDLFMNKISHTNATKITQNDQQEINVTIDDFLAASDEIHIIKYGAVLQNIIKAVNA
ncbi:MAG: NUDIX domain-containing protein [Alphaproteobacteria bacterium]|nr:NUDIX domain-containing protein [Alphaproteobacteria bacterium]